MKNWRKMLEEVGGYENELAGVPAGGVREMVEEIESLRQQLSEAAKSNEDCEHHYKNALDSVSQQLTAALAAFKVKDALLTEMLLPDRDWPITDKQIVDALAIQPDDSALKAWLEMSNTADCRPQSSLQGVVK